MFLNCIYILTLIFSLILPHKFELDFGWQTPQGIFDKYNEPGGSIRATYSWISNDKAHIRYDFSFQKLAFRSDSWIDNNQYPITVTNSEESLGFLFGPRIMSPTVRGFLRPYFGIKGGFFIFSEKLKYEWDDQIGSWDWACLFINLLNDEENSFCYDDNDDNFFTNTLERKIYLGAIFEFGANMKINDLMGLDFGIQYNIIPKLRAISSDYQNLENQMIQLTQISKTISADYLTVYLGVYLDILSTKEIF
tara:strand:+ start:299 stop:1048 length:750 start_codon:yes stop_codon:yes gene_type:complete